MLFHALPFTCFVVITRLHSYKANASNAREVLVNVTLYEHITNLQN